MIIAMMAVVLFGCLAADGGAKEVGGYFDENTVFAIEAQSQYYYITLFNEEFKIKRKM